MKCPHCGQEVSAGAKFCPKCGQRIEHGPAPGQPRQTAAPQPAPQPAPKRGRAARIVGIVLAMALVAAAVAAACYLLLGPAGRPDSPASGAASSAPAPAQTETEPASSAPPATSAQKDDRPAAASPGAASAPAVTPPAASSAASAPIIQQADAWGQQEILITPTGGGAATLTLRQMYNGEWMTLLECSAAIGRNGTTTSPREGDGMTPAGTFPIEFCYGLEQPDTGIPFIQVQSDSVFVDDSSSPYYNCLTTASQADGASHEDTYSQFERGFYSINIFFANNGDGQTPGSATPGLGSVRVLEGYTGALEPTNGDIKISARDMEALLAELDAVYAPVVTVLAP